MSQSTVSFIGKRIEMKQLWLLFLLYTRTIYSKVIISDNPISLRNNNVSREDWINLAKYYVSHHKPYNVKKYVPYRPSNKEIIPVIPEFSSSTPIPEVTTPLFGTSTSSIDLDFESTTRSDQATETTSEMSLDSTTETFSTSTQFPETSTMLLSIIGSFPGIETTTRIPYDDALEETTGQVNFNYTTTEVPFINFSTETEISTTTLLPDPEITSEASSPETSTTTTVTFESTTERIDSTTQNLFHVLDNSSMDEFVISTTTPELESTTMETESTTTLSLSTTEKDPSGNDTTKIEPAIPESTTNIFNLIKNFSMDKFIISTTTPSLDTTTENGDSTTEFPVSTIEVPPSTTMEPLTFESTTEKIGSTTQKSSSMEEFVMTSTETGLETTTEERDSTTEPTTSIPTTESSENDTTTEIGSVETSTNFNGVEKTTEANADAELTTTMKNTKRTGENANFNGDIIQPKPRKFTYSSDVMPEPYW